MKKVRYKYRIYPTLEQKAHLAKEFGCVRFVYNWGLRKQLDAISAADKRPNMVDLSQQLTTLKKQLDYSWLKDVSSDPLQQTLRHLDKAWNHCFSKRNKRPRFKKRRGDQSISYTTHAFRILDGKLFFAKMKQPFDVRFSRPLPSAPKTATILKDTAGRYFVSFTVELDPQPFPAQNKSIGIDLGLTHFFTASDGEKVENPRYLEHDQKKLAKAQRQLAKKQKGSKNREKARQKVARIHAQIADKRRDFLHQLSTRLLRENQAIGIETLAVKNMVKNRKLARGISDVGWSRFVGMLEYKAEWYGRQLVKIDRWFPSSKTCSSCGHVLETLPLDVRMWNCPRCGAKHDRDINAAMNIKCAAGLAVQACGESNLLVERQQSLFQSGFEEAGKQPS
ncbi:MAG: IS200/IS605 family element transposase accessory protein TnpB [Myxococcales bacterium]|nr:IS200/IS605 family element transposase accessory protein TnpB [Myxococcales bacterium]